MEPHTYGKVAQNETDEESRNDSPAVWRKPNQCLPMPVVTVLCVVFLNSSLYLAFRALSKDQRSDGTLEMLKDVKEMMKRQQLSQDTIGMPGGKAATTTNLTDRMPGGKAAATTNLTIIRNATCAGIFNGGPGHARDPWETCSKRCLAMPGCSGFAHGRVKRHFWPRENCVFCDTITGISYSPDFDLYLRETTLAKPPHQYDTAHGAKVREGCGELCSYSIKGVPGKYFDEIPKRVNCTGLFANEFSDSVGKIWPPPIEIPADLQNDYTMGGKAEVHSWPYTNRYAGVGAGASRWTVGMVNGMIEKAKQGTLKGNYGKASVNFIYNLVLKHAALFEGKHILVIGSENPWLEATLLAAGVKKVTTLEYGTIVSEHPQVDSMLPADLRKKFLESGGQAPRFDGVFSFSSIEHSGLGRYGDILNPWGDIQAVAKAWCVTRPEGPMGLGTQFAKKDAIYWQAHRVYGPIRSANLAANWKQLDFAGSKPIAESEIREFLQPVVLFQRAAAPE